MRTPWYKIPQVWLIITFPSLAVIGGSYTMYLAISTSDGLVTDNYYRKGLAINQELGRDRVAEALKLFAQLQLIENTKIRMKLTGKLEQFPDKLTINWQHPTREGFDQSIALQKTADNSYLGELQHGLNGGNWYLSIQQDDWRIKGRLHWPHEPNAVLAGFDYKRH